MTIKIVLVEPNTPGNIGSTARVMKNFGFQDLILINPRTEIKGDAFRFAMRADDIVDNLKVYDSLEEFVSTISFVVGTTAKICTNKGSTNARIAVSSDHPSLDNLLEMKDDVAILFGREEWGLTNEELKFCDMTVHIPTSEDYKALNLAQAVAILLYSLSIRRKDNFQPHYREAKREEKELLIEWFSNLISVIDIKDLKAKFLIRRFRNIIGRAFVSGKEATSLVGVFSRSYKKIKKCQELESE